MGVFFDPLFVGEPEAIALWKRFRELSIEKYFEIYARLNVKFDTFWGESMVKPASMQTVMISCGGRIC